MGQLTTKTYTIGQGLKPQPLISATLGESLSHKAWILAIRASSSNTSNLFVGDSANQDFALAPAQIMTFNKGEIPYNTEIFIRGQSADMQYTIVVYNE